MKIKNDDGRKGLKNDRNKDVKREREIERKVKNRNKMKKVIEVEI